MEALWPDTTVEDANLTVAISQLRKALNQNGDAAEFIETIPRIGYRFVAEIHEVIEEQTPLRNEDSAAFSSSTQKEETKRNEPAAEQPAFVRPPRESEPIATVSAKRRTRIAAGATVVILTAAAVAFFLYRSQPRNPEPPAAG